MSDAQMSGDDYGVEEVVDNRPKADLKIDQESAELQKRDFQMKEYFDNCVKQQNPNVTYDKFLDLLGQLEEFDKVRLEIIAKHIKDEKVLKVQNDLKIIEDQVNEKVTDQKLLDLAEAQLQQQLASKLSDLNECQNRLTTGLKNNKADMQKESQRLNGHKSTMKDNEDKRVDLKQEILLKNKESKEIETQNEKTQKSIEKLQKALVDKKQCLEKIKKSFDQEIQKAKECHSKLKNDFQEELIIKFKTQYLDQLSQISLTASALQSQLADLVNHRNQLQNQTSILQQELNNEEKIAKDHIEEIMRNGTQILYLNNLDLNQEISHLKLHNESLKNKFDDLAIKQRVNNRNFIAFETTSIIEEEKIKRLIKTQLTLKNQSKAPTKLSDEVRQKENALYQLQVEENSQSKEFQKLSQAKKEIEASNQNHKMLADENKRKTRELQEMKSLIQPQIQKSNLYIIFQVVTQNFTYLILSAILGTMIPMYYFNK